MIEIKNSLRPKFPRGAMLRNKNTNKLLYVVETPIRCKMI